jgi:hypothetical protein
MLLMTSRRKQKLLISIQMRKMRKPRKLMVSFQLVSAQMEFLSRETIPMCSITSTFSLLFFHSLISNNNWSQSRAMERLREIKSSRKKLSKEKMHGRDKLLELSKNKLKPITSLSKVN